MSFIRAIDEPGALSCRSNFDVLLVAFFNRAPAAIEELPRATTRYLRKIARPLARDLPSPLDFRESGVTRRQCSVHCEDDD